MRCHKLLPRQAVLPTNQPTTDMARRRYDAGGYAYPMQRSSSDADHQRLSYNILYSTPMISTRPLSSNIFMDQLDPFQPIADTTTVDAAESHRSSL